MMTKRKNHMIKTIPGVSSSNFWSLSTPTKNIIRTETSGMEELES